MSSKHMCGSIWEKIVVATRELSQCPDINIPFETVAFCKTSVTRSLLNERLILNFAGNYVYVCVVLDTRLGSVKPEQTQGLYFHHNLESNDQRSFWGFFSTSSDPDCQTSRETVERWGWITTYHVYAK